MQCHTSAPSMPRKASDLLRCVNLVVFNYKYIHNVDTSYTILEWNAILRNVGKGVPKKKGSIYRLLNVPPLLFIVFSSFFHAFHQPPATATAGAPNEHGFPAGLIPAGQHSPCIHRFELGQRHGFPTIRALVSSAGWQGRILPPEVVNGYINGSCICEC